MANNFQENNFNLKSRRHALTMLFANVINSVRNQNKFANFASNKNLVILFMENRQSKLGWLLRLKDKWQVASILKVILILCTFAIGGSLSGIIGKQIMSLLAFPSGIWWVVVYILIVSIVWPLCVLMVSVFFGQYSFFKTYLRKMGRRIAGKKS